MIILSIVIPTRNREIYCIEAIKYILSFDETNFELVVQDNSDSNLIQDYVNTLENEKRLVYHKTIGRINSVVNMDLAVSMAKGDYVIMIGDDDVILPNIFQVVRWAKQNNCDAISPVRQHAYFWSQVQQKSNGTFIMFPEKNKKQECIAQDQLMKLLVNGLINYQEYKLPRVYHGLMKRSILTQIYQKTGHFIGGLSPDIYLAVASSFYIDKYVVIYEPISIQGICPQSTAWAGETKTHRGRLEDAPHLFGRGEYIWEKCIPPIYSVETIWAESALKAIQENAGKNQSEWLSLFNQRYFNTVFRWKNRSIKNIINNIVGENYPSDFYCLLRYFFKKGLSLFRSFCWRIKGRRVFKHLTSWKSVIEVYITNHNI